VLKNEFNKVPVIIHQRRLEGKEASLCDQDVARETRQDDVSPVDTACFW
jgi:hypothetical protein